MSPEIFDARQRCVTSLMEFEETVRADERKRCHEEVSALIKSGELSTWEHEQRNGLILAANQLAKNARS